MSKFKKLIKGLSLLFSKPYLINKIIEDGELIKENVISKYPQFKYGLPVINLLELLPNFNESINPFAFLHGGSLPTDLALLKGLANKKMDCTYFEIGTWRGESVTNVAEVAKECFTLNLSNDELNKLGYNEEYINQQGFFSLNKKNITHLKGNSFDFDFSPYFGKCDVVFIDGDHRYESVVNDTKIAYKLLRNEHSVIVWHDYAIQPSLVRWDVLQGIIDGTPKDKIDNLFHVSNTLCAIYSNSNHKTFENNTLTPVNNFEVTIKGEKI